MWRVYKISLGWQQLNIMQVPTTETFSSRHKASKDLADGNALLIQQKEIIARELKDLKNLKEEIIRKSGYTPAEYAKVEHEHYSRIKDIEDSIVRARIELGQLENAIVDMRAGLKNMTAQEAVLAPKLEFLTSDIKILTERKENAIKSTEEATRKYDALILQKSKELSLLTSKVNASAESNLIVTKEMEKRLASVIEQERSLSIRRTDLEIYETRLRKKYPNEPIIL